MLTDVPFSDMEEGVMYLEDQIVYFDYLSKSTGQQISTKSDELTHLSNRQEAEIFAEMQIESDADMEMAAHRILEQGTECVVITSGEKGVFYQDRSGIRIRKCHAPLQPVSATGAGDSFTAAMVYGWLADLSAEDSLELAMRAAEITLMDPLTVSPAIGTLVK